MIIIAAPEVKPASTGCDKKFTKNPALIIDRPNCNRPAINDTKMASCIYSGDIGSANVHNPVATRIDTIATGPTDKYGDDPKSG